MDTIHTSYEITYLVRNEEDAPSVSEILTKHGAEISREDALRKIQLAYLIKKEAFAFLGVVRFQADPSRLRDLQADLRLHDVVLRFLVTRPVSLPTRPRGGEVSQGEHSLGRRSLEGRRALSSGPSQTLSNEALQEKIEEILQ